jgi:hypothetical protein
MALTAGSARAEEHASIEFEGGKAVVQKRAADGAWDDLCSVPCIAPISAGDRVRLATPAGLVDVPTEDLAGRRFLRLRWTDGRETRTTVAIAGAGIAAVGVGLTLIGLVGAASDFRLRTDCSPMYGGHCGPDETKDDRDLMVGGLVTVGIGAVVALASLAIKPVGISFAPEREVARASPGSLFSFSF